MGKKSPFKGFLDISIVTQKLRKSMKSQDSSIQGLDFGSQNISPEKSRRGESNKKGPVRATA